MGAVEWGVVGCTHGGVEAAGSVRHWLLQVLLGAVIEQWSLLSSLSLGQGVSMAPVSRLPNSPTAALTT